MRRDNSFDIFLPRCCTALKSAPPHSTRFVSYKSIISRRRGCLFTRCSIVAGRVPPSAAWSLIAVDRRCPSRRKDQGGSEMAVQRVTTTGLRGGSRRNNYEISFGPGGDARRLIWQQYLGRPSGRKLILLAQLRCPICSSSVQIDRIFFRGKTTSSFPLRYHPLT